MLHTNFWSAEKQIKDKIVKTLGTKSINFLKNISKNLKREI